MKCNKCNSKNSINSKFCSNCGEELENYFLVCKRVLLTYLKVFFDFVAKNSITILLLIITVSLFKIAFFGVDISGDIYAESKIDGGYIESVGIEQ